GAEGGTVMAFDKENGKELWRALNAKEPGYSSPVICDAAGRRQLIVWNPESVNALEPESGKVFWTVPFRSRMGLSVATPRVLGNDAFVTSFYSGSLMLQLEKDKPVPRELWRTQKPSEKDTTHLNAILCTPFLENGYIYGVCSYGQLRCLKM